MSLKRVLAIDLGAESGRVMSLNFDSTLFRMEEIYRFPNVPVNAGGTLNWNVLSLWHEIKTGIAKTVAHDSIGIDTWGTDFALLDREGTLLSNPIHYRDPCTEGMIEWVLERIPKKTLYSRTGVQFMRINGLYRLAYLVKNESPLLSTASTFLTIADLFNFWLCGNKSCEFTHATTQQIFNPILGDWDYETMKSLEIRTDIFPEVLQPGSKIGHYHNIPIILTASHDTASAVVSVPAIQKDFAFLSSGTWSLLGLELDELIINEDAFHANFTNEGGFAGTNRFLKNISGLWLMQQCLKTWRENGKEYTFNHSIELAGAAPSFKAIIDPDSPEFMLAGDMPLKIINFCKNTNQSIPLGPGEILRVIYESLAFKYRYVLELLVNISGKEVRKLHVVGGGSRNNLLNQFCANAMNIPVIAGPAEATAFGNGLVQLISLGEVRNISEGREILANSVNLKIFEPQQTELWEEQFQSFKRLIN